MTEAQAAAMLDKLDQIHAALDGLEWTTGVCAKLLAFLLAAAAWHFVRKALRGESFIPGV